MKVYGSITRLVNLVFRKDSNDVTLRPNQTTTYTASRDIQLPAGDTAHVLVSATSTATLTNKSIDADTNTITNIENADIKAAAAIDATKIADGTVTSTEFQYINTLSSNAQTQLDGKASTALSNLTVASLAAESLLVGSSSSAVVNLPVGSNGDVLTVTAGAVGWAPPVASVASFKATWLLADGTTKSVTHSLGTSDVMIQVFDSISGETIEVDTAIRTDANTVDLTASEAPGVSWRVLILAV